MIPRLRERGARVHPRAALGFRVSASRRPGGSQRGPRTPSTHDRSATGPGRGNPLLRPGAAGRSARAPGLRNRPPEQEAGPRHVHRRGDQQDSADACCPSRQNSRIFLGAPASVFQNQRRLRHAEHLIASAIVCSCGPAVPPRPPPPGQDTRRRPPGAHVWAAAARRLIHQLVRPYPVRRRRARRSHRPWGNRRSCPLAWCRSSGRGAIRNSVSAHVTTRPDQQRCPSTPDRHRAVAHRANSRQHRRVVVDEPPGQRDSLRWKRPGLPRSYRATASSRVGPPSDRIQPTGISL